MPQISGSSCDGQKKKKVEIIVKQKPNKLRDIPLSAHFLGSHIENISEDIRKI